LSRPLALAWPLNVTIVHFNPSPTHNRFGSKDAEGAEARPQRRAVRPQISRTGRVNSDAAQAITRELKSVSPGGAVS